MVNDGNVKRNNVETEMQESVETDPESIGTYGIFGDCEAVSWCLAKDGELVISGFGKVPDFSCGKNPALPWEDKKDLIRCRLNA